MTAFVPGTAVTTRLAQITVDGDLSPGPHRFTLVVSDDSGNLSTPAEVVVLVSEQQSAPRPEPPIFRPEPPIFRATDPRFTAIPAPRQPAIRPLRPQ